MSEITITRASNHLGTVVDEARKEPVYLTRRGKQVAAVVDADQLNQLIEDAEDLADIRAVDAAWREVEETGAQPIPWETVKRDLGLA
ncbi:prevent-host-death family protein [Psychromicrobium silvestre]|uniref:Antitoxin n=1 Tax=Psychromicrobium silvestre TaxID=1645614 RepID=A0A7Y9S7M9_9MICC|nr:type II toxin-antitoxin system Phd/YefM family antitoxin [Psychromicrobium silvestre]NYE95735.1 prevent-host-death family protein [Psychromicrobium silvestre]